MAWSISLGGVFLTAMIALGFVLQQKSRIDEIEERREQRLEDRRAMEDQYRLVLARVYQNLKLNHFLAAQRNLEALESIWTEDPVLIREYNEAVFRIAEGLLENGFHDEAEALFLRLQQEPAYEDRAREAMAIVASSRRRDSARRLYETGKTLLEEGRYREASAELRKARLEFDSVLLFRVHDVSEEIAALGEQLRAANYHVAVMDTQYFIDTAKGFLEQGHFDDTQAQLRRAVSQLSRARLNRPQSERITKLREQIVWIENEIAYRMPNLMPILNRLQPRAVSEVDDFFLLESYDLQRNDERVHLQLSYQMNLERDQFFVVRYRVHFHNGLHFQNGHFFDESLQTELGVPQKIVFDQELPEHLVGLDIKSIELRVYDSRHRMLSRVLRAYRPQTPA